MYTPRTNKEYLSDVSACMYKDPWLPIWLDVVCFSKSLLRIALVENIPEGLNYSENAPFHLSLFQGWMNLLNMAQKSVDIVSSHWDLNHSHPSACQVSRFLCACGGFPDVPVTLLSIPASASQGQAHFFSLPSPVVHVHHYIFVYVLLLILCC